MRRIERGGKVSLELEDWVNKSLGRTPVIVIVDDENGNEMIEQDYFQYYTGYTIKELAEVLFPWSTARIDQEFYDENAEPESPEDAFLRVLDEDHGIVYKVDPYAVYPYSSMASEVDSYRLMLELNDIGRAYLLLSDYLQSS